ncbi:MAG: TlpA disulfide reductase family protein [Syntrophomonadaceae bacterium]
MRSQTILLGLIILVTAFLSGCGLYRDSRTSTDPPSGTPNQTGSPAVKGQAAPEIVLQDLDGKTVRLSDYRGKVVILNFWASWCPPCKAEMPELEQASREFAQGSEAVLLTVNMTDGSRETPAKARQYIQANRYTMPVWLDIAGQAADDYNVTSIPTTFIIDKQGHIGTRFSGATTREALQDFVDQLK